MKKESQILYFSVASLLSLSTSSFGMMDEQFTYQHQYVPNKSFYVQLEKTPTPDITSHSRSMPKNEEVNYDKKLAAIYGRNLSSFPLSEETYKFIVDKVGLENKRPFVFKTGPQIIFPDEVNLLH